MTNFEEAPAQAIPGFSLAPANILIVRLSAIGDVILSSALIPVLREAYPFARLVWLVDDINTGLLIHNQALDKVIALPRGYWKQLIKQRRYLTLMADVRRLIRELRAERFDLALDLQGLLKSGVWARLSGARLRIGLGSREGSQHWMHHVVSRRSEIRRPGAEYRLLAQALGLDPGDFPMDIAVPELVREQVDGKLASAGVRQPFVVICPFTTRPQKHWFDDRWRELVRRLVEERGLQVLMLGGPGDRTRARSIADGLPGLVDLTGTTALIEAAAMISRASALIGVDTGLTHLGIAMKTPSLALFGSTRPYLNTGVDYAKVLYEPLPCSPCRRRPTCEGDFTCMKQHTAERVMAELQCLLPPTP
jgi:heptosyltransferase-1